MFFFKRSKPMSHAATSTFVYALYSIVLGLTLLLIPNVPLSLIGLPATHEVWIHIAGMSVLFLASYFLVAARREVTDFFRLSVLVRFSVPFFFGAFVLFGLAKPALLLLCVFDVLFGIWTALSLRADGKKLAVAAASA
jgi:hypothetical protein